MEKVMDYLKIFFSISVIVLSVGWLDTATAYAEDIVCEGVYIDDIDIGGKTEAEADKLVSDYVDELGKKNVKVEKDDKTAEKTMEDLGLDVKENDYVHQALNIGKEGNLIQRYKDLKDAKHDKKVYNLEISYDSEKLSEFVEEDCTTIFNEDAKEPTLKNTSGGIFDRDDISGAFDIEEGSNGSEIDKDDTLENLKTSLDSWDKKDVSFEPKITEIEPETSIDSLKECTTRLGTMTTNFSSSGASGQNRVKNLKRATKLVNGSVVSAGETFSILKKITPVTEGNGYAAAGSYSNGKVVDSVGGGICQVSTTLYDAVLYSELEVVYRSNHSMQVGYVEPAFDAMIESSSGADFKFKNNTDTPIYIEGFTTDSSITFNIYGKETRSSSRKVELKSEVNSTVEPGEPVIVEDSTKPVGYRETTQSAHQGCTATLYKIVTENGSEKKTVINKSTYKASPEYITEGTGESSD